MNAHELETAVRHGINVVTIVMNNNCWGSEKAYQRAFYGGRYIGCDIGNPRYDAFARLFGAEGYYAETPGPGRRRGAGGAGLRQAGGGRDPDRPRRVPDAGGRGAAKGLEAQAFPVPRLHRNHIEWSSRCHGRAVSRDGMGGALRDREVGNAR